MSEQRIALITNVHEYAGPGTVTALLAAGIKVVGHDRRFAEANARAKFERENPGAVAMTEQEPEQLAAGVLRDHGRVDALVSNDILTSGRKKIEEATIEEYRQFFELGMVWPFTLSRALVPQMKQRRAGAIVLITSGTALRPTSKNSMYSSVRAGAAALATSLSKELGPHLVVLVNADAGKIHGEHHHAEHEGHRRQHRPR